MATDKFITLEELNTTTQALLSKINEQSNLKVDKVNVTSTLDSGIKIGSIDGKDFYAPEGVTLDDLSNLYENLSNQIPQRVSDLYNDVKYVTTATQAKSNWNETTTTNAAFIFNKPAIIASATGTNAIIEGDLSHNKAISNYSHAEGSGTFARGVASHAEGYSTTASGAYSHAEGQKTIASGTAAHSEGYSTTASGNCSHAEGQGVIASGPVSHAEGLVTEASGTQSHAEGDHTIARRKSQHVFGEYNTADPTGTATTRGTFVEIVGNGTATSRSNARTLDWNGNETLAGKLTVGTAPTADMDVATKKYVDDNISSVIGNGNAFNVSVVQSLPSSNIDTHTIYFISNSGDTGNIYDEYMYINNSWEKLGTTEIDLNKYWATHTIAVSYDSTNDEYSFFESKDGISGTDLTLEDVYNYLEEDFENVILVYGTELFYFSGATSNGIYIFTSPISHDKIYLDDNNLRYDTYVKPTYTAAEVGALPDTTVIPTIPTNVSTFTNDAGYLTSYTETDPTVPEWAKAANKPTYTASEVGALPDTTIIPTKINDLTNKIFGIAWLDNSTTGRYIYCNNINFSHTGDSYFSSPFLFMFKRDTYRVGEVGTLKGTTNFKFYDINTNAITGVTASGFYMIPSTETLKYGVCYIGYLNDGTVNLQPLTTISNVNSMIASAIGNINSFEVSIVASLPTENIDTHTIYFMTNNSSGDSIYDEYMYINNNWEKIGSTAIDLSGYLQATDIADWAKAATKPTYTYTEVGAAASSHTHGSITNAGAITSNTALANGDRLVFSDNSDSGLLKRASITIGNSTTQYLANNGTWQTLPTVSVSQTLTSGTEIGSVNNTKLYAPTPYDDTALAARVTALENLEWATYYSGRSNPSSAQGQNGDIYLQY